MPLIATIHRALVASMAISLLGAGCASPVDTRAERVYLSGDDRGAIEEYAARLEEPSKREALDANLLATAALVGGDLRRAREAFIDAGRIMGSFPSAQTGALVGAEGSKIYLGDPYEAAMNSLYNALVLLATGDEDNARAALKRGILADSASQEEEYNSDIAALFLLEAWLQLRVGKVDLARLDLEQVRGLIPGCALADADQLRRANTVIIVDVGEGPQKIRTGRHEEVATFAIPQVPVTGIHLEIGGGKVEPTLGVDVAFQATTRGGRRMDGILQGKAVLKDATAVAGWILLHDTLHQDSFRHLSAGDFDKRIAIAGGLFLLSALTRAEADIRHWHLLPAYSYLWIGHVDPGLHDVSLRFRGPEGGDLPGYRQSWHHLPFREEGINAYYFRSGPRRGFGHAPGNSPGAERGSP